MSSWADDRRSRLGFAEIRRRDAGMAVIQEALPTAPVVPPDAQPRARDGRDVLTAPAGPLGDISEEVRRNVVILSDGTFLVHKAALHDARILSLKTRAAGLEPSVTLKAPQIADLGTIREFYGQSAMRKLDDADGLRRRLIALLEEAAESRASDIQIAFNTDVRAAKVRFQIDGFLTDVVEEFHDDEIDALFTTAFYYADNGDTTPNPSKNQKVTVNKRHKLPDNVFSFRMHFANLAGGRHLNIRVIHEKLPVAGTGLKALGLSEEIERTLLYVQSLGKGLFTLAAPTEHGKSTTLTIWLGDLMDSRQNRLTIVSVDDPPEGLDPRFLYFPINDGNPDGEDSHIAAIKASLRVAPHVVRISECREGPSARMAFDVGNTGKLACTTIHCPGVLNVPSRYEELGVPHLLAYNAERHCAWYSQRLVPQLCQGCRRPILDAAADDLRFDVLHTRFRAAIGNKADDLYVRGTGCPDCSGGRTRSAPGIKGRRLLAEILLPTRHVCALLEAGDYDGARRHWLTELGGRSMSLDGYQHLLAGLIGAEEWVSFVSSAEDLALDLQYSAAKSASTPRAVA